MGTCKYRIYIAFIDTITFDRLVLFGNEGFMLGLQPLQSFFKCHKVSFLLQQHHFIKLGKCLEVFSRLLPRERSIIVVLHVGIACIPPYEDI